MSEPVAGSSRLDLDMEPSDPAQPVNGLDLHDLPQPDRYGFFPGGKQFKSSPDTNRLPVEKIREREVKWIGMLDQTEWKKWLAKRRKKVLERCAKGIPQSMRMKAWTHLCQASERLDKFPNLFRELDAQEGDPRWVNIIEKDLHRQFPEHEIFAEEGGFGQQDLFRVLKAYTLFRADDGYCQGQAPVAATLLMHMPAENAFWCLVCICDRYLKGYYSKGLVSVQLDGEILHGLLKQILPATYKHLRTHRVEPVLYMLDWFMCLYCRSLPWETVLRIWDRFFIEERSILFRVALALIKSVLGTKAQLERANDLYEIVNALREIPHTAPILQTDVLFAECARLGVSDKDIATMEQKKIAKFTQNGMLTGKATAGLRVKASPLPRAKRSGKVSPLSSGSQSESTSPQATPGYTSPQERAPPRTEGHLLSLGPAGKLSSGPGKLSSSTSKLSTSPGKLTISPSPSQLLSVTPSSSSTFN